MRPEPLQRRAQPFLVFHHFVSAFMATIRIAAAESQHVPLLLSLIRELAEFERLLDQVSASEEQLRESLFGQHRYAEVVIAWLGEEPVGFALFFHNYSTFLAKPGIYLEDLYVRPPFRGEGCGKALLRYLAQLAVERACGRLEWSVLDWNQRAIDFYESLGAKPLDEWTMYRVTGEALEKLAKFED
jgi:GNAT superfamily N-acetyltransferase